MALLDKFDAIDANELVDFLVERRHILPPEVKLRLKNCFSDENYEEIAQTVASAEDFDLKSEIMQQMLAVRALRERATDPDGPPVSIKETKEALSATTSLLTLLSKINGDVYNQDRVRLLQVATIEVLKEVNPALQEKFVDLLEARLKK